MKSINHLILIFILFISINSSVLASRITDSYDGNIFPIYAGNGSIVPPQTTLEESLKNHRVSVLFFYLDDSSASKSLAPVISGLDLIWRNNIDIIALTTDELQGLNKEDPNKANYYWKGLIPQTVIIDDNGLVRFDRDGKVNIDELNKTIGEIKGIDTSNSSFSVQSFNEYNSRISKEN